MVLCHKHIDKREVFAPLHLPERDPGALQLMTWREVDAIASKFPWIWNTETGQNARLLIIGMH